MKPVNLEEKYPKIPNEYIVVFKPGTADAAIQSHMDTLKTHEHTKMHDYHIKASDAKKEFRGYSIRVPSEDAPALKFHVSEVQYVEQNAVVRASAECKLQTQATWGIVRTAEVAQTSAGLYTYTDAADGAGVTAYVVDTGIYTDNVDFEGRAIWGADFASDPSPGTDLNGHGTHVAGTIMGKTFGVAKAAKAVGVAVLGADGSRTTAGVIAGINWSTAQSQKNGKGKSIGNMSLGGGKSTANNDAVNAAFAAGLPFIVAAGNEAQYACEVSPASATDAYTVMSSDSADAMSYFSNYGSCAQIIAPGSGITAAWIGNKYAINTISGTSMASPHVAGVAAKLLSQASYSPASLYETLTKFATTKMITNIPSAIFPSKRSPNLLLHMACDEVLATNHLRGSNHTM